MYRRGPRGDSLRELLGVLQPTGAARWGAGFRSNLRMDGLAFWFYSVGFDPTLEEFLK